LHNNVGIKYLVLIFCKDNKSNPKAVAQIGQKTKEFGQFLHLYPAK
jgi:hypothetical protein